MSPRVAAQGDPLQGIRAVLFDLDGTLIAVDQGATDRFLDRLVPSGRPAPPDWLRRAVRRALMLAETPTNYLLAAAEKLELNTDVLFAADRFRRLKGLGTSSRSALIPGVHDLLEALRSRYQLGVVTSRSRRSTAHFLREHELAAFFQVVTTRHDTWLLKPSPAPIRRTARLLGVEPGDCAMVGDTAMDIRSAKSAGAVAIGVLSGLGEMAEIRRAGADLILAQATDLRPTLLLDHGTLGE